MFGILNWTGGLRDLQSSTVMTEDVGSAPRPAGTSTGSRDRYNRFRVTRWRNLPHMHNLPLLPFLQFPS
ncbi:hypothetical protein J6590_052770 [Homalodisca vitripennis]|nr:hypothetical protein J6590_052770 [Homalodisca vitripennis]